MYSAAYVDADAVVRNKIYNYQLLQHYQNLHQQNPMIGVLNGGYVISVL